MVYSKINNKKCNNYSNLTIKQTLISGEDTDEDDDSQEEVKKTPEVDQDDDDDDDSKETGPGKEVDDDSEEEEIKKPSEKAKGKEGKVCEKIGLVSEGCVQLRRLIYSHRRGRRQQ